MYQESRPDYRTDTAAMKRVAELLGISSSAQVRQWVRQDEVDHGTRAGITSEESDTLRRLKRENAELRRANLILKQASCFFAAELDRPSL
jgi:transposase